jgi:hypothetical protein
LIFASVCFLKKGKRGFCVNPLLFGFCIYVKIIKHFSQQRQFLK